MYCNVAVHAKSNSRTGEFSSVQFIWCEQTLIPFLVSPLCGLNASGMGEEYCDERVCLPACLPVCSVCTHISGTACPDTHPFNGHLPGRDYPGAGTRKVKPIWILLKQETVSGNGISWAICKSDLPRSRQITTPAPHHSVFCRPDALPAAQPTASKHWRHAQTSPNFLCMLRQ